MKNNDNNLFFLGEAKIYSLSRIKGGTYGLLMQNISKYWELMNCCCKLYERMTIFAIEDVNAELKGIVVDLTLELKISQCHTISKVEDTTVRSEFNYVEKHSCTEPLLNIKQDPTCIELFQVNSGTRSVFIFQVSSNLIFVFQKLG